MTPSQNRRAVIAASGVWAAVLAVAAVVFGSPMLGWFALYSAALAAFVGAVHALVAARDRRRPR